MPRAQSALAMTPLQEACGAGDREGRPDGLVIAVSAFTKSVFMVGIGVIIMGIVVFLLPFTTPETIAFLGYKRAKTAGRIAGIVLIAVGIWVGLI